VLDAATIKDAKTKKLAASFGKLGLASALIVDGAFDEGFERAARNIPNIDLLTVTGINVLDMLRREKLVLTKAALSALEERFK
jgi:large subunit ribosomal protein L4